MLSFHLWLIAALPYKFQVVYKVNLPIATPKLPTDAWFWDKSFISSPRSSNNTAVISHLSRPCCCAVYRWISLFIV